jgi:hypothetical protein
VFNTLRLVAEVEEDGVIILVHGNYMVLVQEQVDYKRILHQYTAMQMNSIALYLGV